MTSAPFRSYSFTWLVTIWPTVNVFVGSASVSATKQRSLPLSGRHPLRRHPPIDQDVPTGGGRVALRHRWRCRSPGWWSRTPVIVKFVVPEAGLQSMVTALHLSVAPGMV